MIVLAHYFHQAYEAEEANVVVTGTSDDGDSELHVWLELTMKPVHLTHLKDMLTQGGEIRVSFCGGRILFLLGAIVFGFLTIYSRYHEMLGVTSLDLTAKVILEHALRTFQTPVANVIPPSTGLEDVRNCWIYRSKTDSFSQGQASRVEYFTASTDPLEVLVEVFAQSCSALTFILTSE